MGKEALKWFLAFSVFGLAVYVAALAGGKLTKIITYNPGFWVVIVLSFAFGFYRKLTNPSDFTWRELPIQLAVTFVAIVLIFAIFFVSSTDIWDKEIRNGYIQRAEYWEAWTERVSCVHMRYCSRSNGRGGTETYICGTLHAYDSLYHPPVWKICAVNIDDLSVSRTVYANYASRWNNQRLKHVVRLSRISFGDGNMYFTVYNDRPDLFVPASQEYSFVNYLKASHETIRRRFSTVDLYTEYKKPYPRVYEGSLGPIEIDRIISAGVNLPVGWSVVLDREFDIALASLGARKQVNILLYLVGSGDVGAGLALEEAWVKGKKNDVVLFIGVKNFPQVDWVHVSAWTENEEFKIGLRDRIMGIKKEEFMDPRRLAKIIVGEIDKPTSQGGFERMPMEKLEYLISDVRLPWWSQVLIVVLAGLANWYCSRWLIRERVV